MCCSFLSTYDPAFRRLKRAVAVAKQALGKERKGTQKSYAVRWHKTERHMPSHPLRIMSQSLPAALLSLAYITASRTTAFVLAPSRSSLVTAATGRRALLPAAAHRRATTSSRQQQQHLSPGSTRFAAAPARSTLGRSSRSGSAAAGGVRSLKSVAVPAGLEKGVSGGLGELLHPRNGVKERFVFFGGKGGVGKTSTSAAVAIQCADAGLR